MTKYLTILIWLIFWSTGTTAQARIQQSKFYKSGESFSAPLYGIQFTVPDGWTGYLPMETEIFMMNNDSAVDARCMYFARQGNLKNVKSAWKKGFALAPGLDIVTDGKIKEVDGILMAGIKLTNNNTSKGFVLAKCGPYDQCISVMMYTGAQFINNYEGKLRPLLDNITFVKPTPRSELDKYDWQKALTGKMIFAYERELESKKDNRVWLNLDGTFTSKSRVTGLFANTGANYKGKKRGTYLIYNDGDAKPARLILFFRGRSDELVLELTKDDRHFFINGKRFYISEM